MKWLSRLREYFCGSVHNELIRYQHRAEQLQRIARALAESVSLEKMAEIVANECKLALNADAVCVYMLRKDGVYEMISELNCTDEFKTKWRLVPKSMVPLPNPTQDPESYFYGSTEQFKSEIPNVGEVVEKSKRQTVGYAPLIVSREVLGLIGYSYNSVPKESTDKTFLITLVNLCAQALERARLSEQEKRAQEAADNANQAKSKFLASISHEIRTPLAVIQGFADLLADSYGLTSQQRSWASIIRKNSAQLGGIVGNVLDISRIEAGKVDVEKIAFSPRDLFEDVKATAEFKVKTKKQSLAVEFTWRNLPEMIESDPTRLKQILNNLVGNAIKFTQYGMVKVEAEFREPDLLECTVTDTGLGIPPENRERIFDPFEQGESSGHRRFGGAGLGLAISKRLAQALGGDLVLVESELGRGSKFRFSVKCQPVTARELMPNVHSIFPKNVATSRELSGFNVLVVEDNPDNQQLVYHLLDRAGARVDLASDGAEGVKMALAGDYDVILMDIQMPEVDGFQAVSFLRTQGYRKAIAALTAHALQSERDQAMIFGFDEYLTKPIDRLTLIDVIQRLRNQKELKLPH